MRLLLAVLTVLVMGCALTGVGMGRSAAERTPAPEGGVVQAARARIAGGGAALAAGRATFEDQGCDRCHAIAAIGAGGRLGPRLDAIDDDADDVVESIVDPRDHVAEGFPEKLMPTDYGRRIADPEIRRLAAFVVAASGAEGGEQDDGRRGREDRSGHGGGSGRDGG
jgi:mono/diheme cytochrome c family protein